MTNHKPRCPRVFMDLTFANKSRTGTRVYARRVCEALLGLEGFDLEALSATPTPRMEKTGNVWTGAQNMWWLQVELPRRLARHGADLFHAAAFLGPIYTPCPMIVNLLDTTYLAFPDDFDYKWRLYTRLLVPPTVRRAAVIITLSEYAKTEIMRAYRVAPERVRVVYPGVGAEFRAALEPSRLTATRARYGLGENYLLFVGATEPRKNVAALVQAVARLRGQFPNLELALIGPRGRGWGAIENAITQHRMQNAVRELGFVAQADLPYLYAGARAFVFPSLLEGFGMPLIEAMACGTPVVAAPNPPTPEVVGAAACLARGSDAAALGDAITRVLCDEHYAAELRAMGQARAERFSWERAARETAQVYYAVWQAHARAGRV